MVATAKGSATAPNLSGIFLFGFICLFAGGTNPGEFYSSGLGWYCAWVAIIVVVYSILSFFSFGDALPRAGRGW